MLLKNKNQTNVYKMFYNSKFPMIHEYWIQNEIDQLKMLFRAQNYKQLCDFIFSSTSLVVIVDDADDDNDDDDVFIWFCCLFSHVHDRYYFSVITKTNSDSRKIDKKKRIMTNLNYKLTRARAKENI